MPFNDGSNRRSSVAPDNLHPHRPSLAVPDMVKSNRRLSTCSQASTSLYGRRRSMAVPRYMQPASEISHHTPKYSNTFKMTPDENKRFKRKEVEDIIEDVLKERLTDVAYSAERCKRFLVPIAEEIKARVKLLGFERYKLVCVAHIGSVNNQGVRIASRCLWDAAVDRVASSSFCNETVFASACVFGVYQQ